MGILDKLKELNAKGNVNYQKHKEKLHAENELRKARGREKQRVEQENKTERKALYSSSYETGYRKGLQKKASSEGYRKATGSGGSTAEHILTTLFGDFGGSQRQRQSRPRPRQRQRRPAPRHQRARPRRGSLVNSFQLEDPFPW